MKSIALLCGVLLLSSCASSNDGFAAADVRQCEPGDPVEISAGVVDPEVRMDGRVTVMVEVANNSNEDFVVDFVRIEPHNALTEQPRIAYDLQGASRTVNQEIKEGEDARFEVPVTVRLRDVNDAQFARGVTIAVDAAVTVKLADGSASRCAFRMPVRFGM
jgi:hypothetical protein